MANLYVCDGRCSRPPAASIPRSRSPRSASGWPSISSPAAVRALIQARPTSRRRCPRAAGQANAPTETVFQLPVSQSSGASSRRPRPVRRQRQRSVTRQQHAECVGAKARTCGRVGDLRCRGITQAGSPSATTGDTTTGRPAASASSTLFCTPRAVVSGVAATADCHRKGRTSGTRAGDVDRRLPAAAARMRSEAPAADQPQRGVGPLLANQRPDLAGSIAGRRLRWAGSPSRRRTPPTPDRRASPAARSCRTRPRCRSVTMSAPGASWRERLRLPLVDGDRRPGGPYRAAFERPQRPRFAGVDRPEMPAAVLRQRLPFLRIDVDHVEHERNAVERRRSWRKRPCRNSRRG